MSTKNVYISLRDSALISRDKTHIADIANVFCPDSSVKDRINDMIIPISLGDNRNHSVISSLKIIELITLSFPNCTVSSIGAAECVLFYDSHQKKKRASGYVKSIFLMLLTFFGTAYSIMSYNGDVGTGDLLGELYTLFTGRDYLSSGGQLSLGIIFYSAGLCIGMIIFFNHGFNRNTKNEPTPLQVQMRLYEQDVNNCIAVDSSRSKESIDVDQA